jgi:GH24 family phage-related lysozyme (muramidase)
VVDGDGVVVRITALDNRGLNLIANMERNPFLPGVVWDGVTGEILRIDTTLADVGYGRDRVQRPMADEPVYLTAAQALRLLREDVARDEEVAASFPLQNQHQFNAVVSLRFNIGSLGSVYGLVDYLNEGVYEKDIMRGLIIAHYDDIIERHPHNERYRQGWYNRTERFLDVFFDGNYGYMPIDAVRGVVIR